MFTTFYCKFEWNNEVIYDSVGFVVTRKEAWDELRKMYPGLEPIAIEVSNSDSKLLAEWIESDKLVAGQ